MFELWISRLTAAWMAPPLADNPELMMTRRKKHFSFQPMTKRNKQQIVHFSQGRGHWEVDRDRLELCKSYQRVLNGNSWSQINGYVPCPPSDGYVQKKSVISDNWIYRIKFSIPILQNNGNFVIYIGYIG